MDYGARGTPLRLLAPRFRLKVYGEDLRPDLYRYVRGVSLEYCVGLADALVLRVENPVSDKTGARLFTDSRLFLEGNPIDLWMGYHTDLRYMGRFYVGKWFPTFPAAGLAELEIRAYDYRMKMAKEVRHDGYTYRKTDSAIAAHVAEVHHGLRALVDPTSKVMLRPHKRGANDLVFLNQLAAQNNYNFFTFHVEGQDRDTLYFGPAQHPLHPYANLAGKRTFAWGDPADEQLPRGSSSLLNFQPSWAVHGQTSKVAVTFRDADGHNVTVQVEALNAPPNHEYNGARKYEPIRANYASGTEVSVTAFGETEEVITDVPVRDRKTARLFAERWFLGRMDSFVLGSGTLVGDAALRPYQTHSLKGLGYRFSGDYYFTMVRHRMDGDLYTVDFNARLRTSDQPVAVTTVEAD